MTKHPQCVAKTKRVSGAGGENRSDECEEAMTRRKQRTQGHDVNNADAHGRNEGRERDGQAVSETRGCD